MSFVELVGVVVDGVLEEESVSLLLVVASRVFAFEFRFEFFGQSQAM